MARTKSKKGNTYILNQLASYKGYGFQKANVAAKPKADASKKKVETKKPDLKKSAPKKSTGFVDAVNDWADRNFRNSVNKSSSSLNKKIQNKLDSVRKEAQKINTKIQKEYGDPVIKKVSEVNKKLQSKVGYPIRKAVYVDKKKEPVKKAETKKPEVKKPATKRMSKEMLEKLTKFGSAYYLDTKSGKLEKNPDVKNTIKKVAEAAKNKQTKVVKSKIESLKRSEIKKKETKPEVVNNNLTTGPTVSQLWKEKTGTSWSEAKKQGLTDGSAAANIALMKKLNSGTVNKESIKAPKPGTAASMDVFKKEMEQNVQDELSGKIKFDEPVPAMRRGGSIKKMRKGGITKRKK